MAFDLPSAPVDTSESSPLLGEQHALESQNPNRPKVTPIDKAQLGTLCTVRLVDPIAFTQIFPYINEMVETFHVAKDLSQVGCYSGLVESVFAVAQLASIYQWAKVSDVIGRRPVIIIGTVGIAAASLMFGLSRSLVGILLARAISGLFCGNVAVMQSVLAEITDSTNQAIAYPIYGLTWPLGVIIGPLIGGILSQPATQYPELFDYEFLRTYPYFLPCFISSVICLIGTLLGILYLKETLPTKRRRPHKVERDYSVTYGATEHNDDILRNSEPPMTVKYLLSLSSMRAICTTGFILSFLGTAFDVIFVLVCYAPIRSGGLAFTSSEIGYSLAICGGIAACVQVFLLPIVLTRFDPAKVYSFCISLWGSVFLLMPVLNIIARNGLVDGVSNGIDPRTKALVWVGVAIMLALSRLGCLAYSLNMILVKENLPSPTAMGAANGLAQFSQCLARAISPAFVSSLFAFSVDHNFLQGYMWVVVMVCVSVYGRVLSRNITNGSSKP